MPRLTAHRLTCWLLSIAACAVVAAGVAGVALLTSTDNARAHDAVPMLLAPMVGVIDTCVTRSGVTSPGDQGEDLQRHCTGEDGSAAELIESTLSSLQPLGNGGPYTLGYTLPAPLLQLFRRDDQGAWMIDQERVARLVRTVQNTNRPLVLYLFSTHFSTGSEIERELAQDLANLAQTRDGPLPEGQYYGTPIYHWTFSTTDTPLTKRRMQAATALLDAMCTLPPQHLAKIKGITLLGEMHHLFPDFQSGMGFGKLYRVTDYSTSSVAGFRSFLQREFGQIDRLNRILGTSYPNFQEIDPPSKDIRTEKLTRYTEHMDSFAQGSFPIAGWVYAPHAQDAPPAWVHVYRNGVFVGKTPVDKGRQDVLEAKPEFGDANTGWRLDLDFKQLPVGRHRLDLYLQRDPGVLEHLGTRTVVLMDRHQTPPQPLLQHSLPRSKPARPDVQASIDLPQELSSFYFNPLVPYWHQFRQQQVVDYLRYFDKVVNASCFANTPHYTHQIVPFANPGWDANKFAIDASLDGVKGIRLGVSLYGEASYGATFAQWHKRRGQPVYGVTEFHPLKGMDAVQLQTVFRQHAQQGASFLSFFLEPVWNGERPERAANPFSFDPQNNQHGSEQLYRSTQTLLSPHREERARAAPQ